MKTELTIREAMDIKNLIEQSISLLEKANLKMIFGDANANKIFDIKNELSKISESYIPNN